jgi:parvulin-like peptidyl-prolyl isomerase
MRADAEKLLAKLRAAGPDAAIEKMGDASMLPAEQPLEPVREVARAFGEDFARDLLASEPGHWTGPLQSPFGLHLVLVRERVAGAPPALSEIRPAIEREVQAERRNAQVQALYDRWLAKYVVTIQKPGAEPAPHAKPAK